MPRGSTRSSHANRRSSRVKADTRVTLAAQRQWPALVAFTLPDPRNQERRDDMAHIVMIASPKKSPLREMDVRCIRKQLRFDIPI